MMLEGLRRWVKSFSNPKARCAYLEKHRVFPHSYKVLRKSKENGEGAAAIWRVGGIKCARCKVMNMCKTDTFLYRVDGLPVGHKDFQDYEAGRDVYWED